jgi:hypothetical protein
MGNDLNTEPTSAVARERRGRRAEFWFRLLMLAPILVAVFALGGFVNWTAAGWPFEYTWLWLGLALVAAAWAFTLWFTFTFLRGK